MSILRISLLLILTLAVCSISASGPLLEEKDDQEKAPKADQDAVQPEAKNDLPQKVTKAEMEARMRRAGVSTLVWLDVLKRQPLTRNQKDQITTIVQAYQEENWKWDQTFGKKLSGLQKEMRMLRAEKKDIPADLRDQVNKLRKERPRPWDMQEKVWNQMTYAQQKEFREDLDVSKTNGFMAPRVPKGRKTKASDAEEEKSLPVSKEELNAPEKKSEADDAKKPAPKKKAEDGEKSDGKKKGYKPWTFSS